MSLRALFVGPDGRAHAPWRLFLFLVLSAACVVVVVIALRPVLATIEGVIGIDGAAEGYATVIALLLAHWMTLRTFDQRPVSHVRLHCDAARPANLARGWLLGALPIGLMSLALVGVGWLDITSMPDGSWTRVAVSTGLFLLPAAFYEELLSRGYIFATLAEWLGTRWAVALTSAAFGLLHFWNPEVSPLSIALVTLAGLYLASVLLATNSLYAAWMAHWAWNWVMAALLHVPVSGLPLDRPDYQIVDSGPDWITGGAWGPEGGAAAGVAMLGVLGFLYWRRPRTTNDTVQR